MASSSLSRPVIRIWQEDLLCFLTCVVAMWISISMGQGGSHINISFYSSKLAIGTQHQFVDCNSHFFLFLSHEEYLQKHLTAISAVPMSNHYRV